MSRVKGLKRVVFAASVILVVPMHALGAQYFICISDFTRAFLILNKSLLSSVMNPEALEEILKAV